MGIYGRACVGLAVLFVLVGLGQAAETPAVAAESAKANAYFDATYDARVLRFPEWQTYQGIKDDYDDWSDNSEEASLREHEFDKRELAWLKEEIDFDLLDEQTQVSYRMAVQQYEDSISNFKYRHYNYPINQMFGRHTGVPSFLINMHLVKDESDAEAYLSRLQKIDEVVDQLIEGLELREEMGIVPPRFVFPRAIASCRKIIEGAPFDEYGAEAPVWEDFGKKVKALGLEASREEELLAAGKKALLEKMEPSYQRIIAYLEDLEKRASDEAGVWKFKDGEAYYNEALRLTTTTNLTADEIHEIGLKEVERIHGEMRGIMKTVDFEGDLQAFFEFMRNDDRFYYPNDDEGKQAYLDRAVAVIDDMKERLDGLFLRKPDAELVVKRVEAFREESAGTAFYNRPAPDGSRPGIYYANLFNMRNMPKYKLEALAYHEGVPGHHMQLALAQQLDGLPKFRKYGGYTAYVEGWGLYCELIPKELGLYEDPYSDFGRLAMELWRACRLVVDTGIHRMKWTREEGIAYYQENTPDTERDCIRMVERHIVMPSQATAYKVGMLKILELRSRAEKALGDRFDLRVFHDVVISNGAVPLSILEELVDDYISETSNGAGDSAGVDADGGFGSRKYAWQQRAAERPCCEMRDLRGRMVSLAHLH